MANREHLQQLAREYSERGLIVEAGWISLRAASEIEGLSTAQMEDMRSMFFGGAQYLMTTIVELDKAGSGDAFDRGMEMINRELHQFISDYIERNCRTVGTA